MLWQDKQFSISMSMILCLCFDKTHSFGDIAGSVKILGCVLFVSEMSALLLFVVLLGKLVLSCLIFIDSISKTSQKNLNAPSIEIVLTYLIILENYYRLVDPTQNIWWKNITVYSDTTIIFFYIMSHWESLSNNID